MPQPIEHENPGEDDDDCVIPETQQIMDCSGEGFNISSQLMNENIHNPSQNLLSDHQESIVIPRVLHSPINLNFSAGNECNDTLNIQRETSVTPDLDHEGNRVTTPTTEKAVTPDVDDEGIRLSVTEKEMSISTDVDDEGIRLSVTEREMSVTPDLDHEGNELPENAKDVSQGSNKENDTSLTQKFQNPLNNPSTREGFNTPESTQHFRQRIVSTQTALKAPKTQGLEETMAFEKRKSLGVTESTQEFRKRIVSTQQVIQGDNLPEEDDADTSSLNTQAFKSRLSSTIMPGDDPKEDEQKTQLNKPRKDPELNEVEEATQVNIPKKAPVIFLAPDSDEDVDGEDICPIGNISRRNAILDSTDDEDDEVHHITKNKVPKGEFFVYLLSVPSIHQAVS